MVACRLRPRQVFFRLNTFVAPASLHHAFLRARMDVAPAKAGARVIQGPAGVSLLPSSLSVPLFAICAIMAVVGQLFIFRDAVAGRTPASSTSTSGRAREILWIVLPALALVLVIFATWRALPASTTPVVPASHPAAPASTAPSRLSAAGS
jgi:hypothetical protein